MKIAISLVFVLASLHSWAKTQTAVVGGFGTDGASLESYPSEDSAKLAGDVYFALQVDPEGPKETKALVVDGEGLFGCDKPKRGIHTYTASCSFEALGKIVSKNPTKVQLGPELSEMIYNALPNGTMRMGATSKSVGNLMCSKVVYKGLVYKCTLTDVMALQVDMPQ